MAANLADLIRSAAGSHPDKAALVEADTSLTWGEFDRRVDRVAAGLADRLSEAGARVGILLPNCIDFAIAYFAILRAGLVAVPLNIGFTAGELEHQLHDAGVQIGRASCRERV